MREEGRETDVQTEKKLGTGRNLKKKDIPVKRRERKPKEREREKEQRAVRVLN